MTFTPGCSQWLAGPLTPVPVAAACNHAFVIPSAVHRAAVLVDNRLPPRHAKPAAIPIADCDQRLGAGAHLVLALHRTSQDFVPPPRGAHNAGYVNPAARISAPLRLAIALASGRRSCSCIGVRLSMSVWTVNDPPTPVVTERCSHR